MTVIINVGSKKRANLRSIKKFLSHIGNKEVNENKDEICQHLSDNIKDNYISSSYKVMIFQIMGN